VNPPPRFSFTVFVVLMVVLGVALLWFEVATTS
jgi:hypothetical protein